MMYLGLDIRHSLFRICWYSWAHVFFSTNLGNFQLSSLIICLWYHLCVLVQGLSWKRFQAFLYYPTVPEALFIFSQNLSQVELSLTLLIFLCHLCSTIELIQWNVYFMYFLSSKICMWRAEDIAQGHKHQDTKKGNRTFSQMECSVLHTYTTPGKILTIWDLEVDKQNT